MTKQEFDLRNERIKASRASLTADIRKERDIDERHHAKALNLITASRSIDEADKTLLKEMLSEGHFAREQWRKDREERIEEDYVTAKIAIAEEYGGGRRPIEGWPGVRCVYE